MFDIDSFSSAKLSDPYSLYPHVADPCEHDPDPLANCCCICYNPYSFATVDPEAEDPVQLPCGHVFGTACFEKWAETSSTCPMCRAELDTQNDVDAAMLDDEYFTWHSHVDADGESEAGYFDAQESCAESHYHLYEDIWLDIAYEESRTLRSSFSSFNIGLIQDLDFQGLVNFRERCASLEQFPPLEKHTLLDDYPFSVGLQPNKDCHFDELVKCHEKWMIFSFDDEESENEFVVSYFDVFTY